MKVLSIGRDESCDIVLNDSNSMISRRHALLKLYPTGKMEIVDMSTNGTFVNGHAIAKNRPYTVKRKDVISFAHIRQLDWKLVPDYLLRIKMVLGAVLAVVIIIAVLSLINSPKKGTPPLSEPDEPQTSNIGHDTAKTKKDSVEKYDKELSPREIRNAFKPKPSNKGTIEKEKGSGKKNSAKDDKEGSNKKKPESKEEQPKDDILF